MAFHGAWDNRLVYVFDTEPIFPLRLHMFREGSPEYESPTHRIQEEPICGPDHHDLE
jgi:hypothetical protein